MVLMRWRFADSRDASSEPWRSWTDSSTMREIWTGYLSLSLVLRPISCCAIFEPGMPVMYSRRVYDGLSMSRYIEAGLSDIGTLGGDVAERPNKGFEGPAGGCVEVTHDAAMAASGRERAGNTDVTSLG